MTARADAIAQLAGLGAQRLAGLVIDSAAPAGALSEWDSQTIESVLAPFEEVLYLAGLPWVGREDNEAHKFWATIARGIGVEDDYEEEATS